MVTAFVLIHVEKGCVPEVAEALTAISSIPEVYSVTGEYDLIAIVRVAAFEALEDVVAGAIGRVPGVSRTETLVAFKCYSPELVERMWQVGMEEEGRS
jgi:DNA-binding Lrp family transcriptional regulator